ncbi:uncharacterized protein LOC116212451 [Punica granatum]|uniref:Uncharacterized protein LOC116212451 n=2 Tax=Punica granatum TaxID=22663 RepID=A0A6P8E8S1_PUNGR|nr:uncharacterized protein LOC116212451 [Punica granatum]PKI36869.1 hypothetical protein CRG98_042818 [Punica granatum]
MAMQSGIGLSKILILAGAGYTGTILLNNGKLSDLLGELQLFVKGLEKSGNQSDGDNDYSEAIAAQVRRLAMEVRQLASSQRVTVLNGNSGQMGNLTNMVVPAATLGALGYGYMWWKGLSFSDLMYVTKRNMANAVASLTQNLECVTEALNATKRHLTQRIEKLDGKMDDQIVLSKEIRTDVCAVRADLDGLGHELETLHQMVFGLDGRLGSLEYKQDWANEGVRYLCYVANGQRVEMPKILQEQLTVSGAPRATLPYPDAKGLKDISDAVSASISLPASDIKGQDRDDKLNGKQRLYIRAPPSIKC